MSIGNQFSLRVSHWAMKAWPFNLVDGDNVEASMRSWSPNGWSKWSAPSTDMAVLESCAAVAKSAEKKGCCDPCDATEDDKAPVVAAGVKLPDKVSWVLDTEIVERYPQSVSTVSLFEPEVDCCSLPIHLQPLCGGCAAPCKGCGAKAEVEVTVTEAAVAAVAAVAPAVNCCSQPLLLQSVCGGCNVLRAAGGQG